MKSDRYAQLREVFLAARELPVDERQAFVRARCGGDDELRIEAERLLARDAAGTERLDRPALGSGFELPDPAALHDSPLPPGMPDRLGGYRLLGVLGIGGMGIVYRAVQQSPSREVALKVLRPGQANAAHVARFRFEVEALGRLQHPFIAAIFDAGTFDHGAGLQPFLAMELIDGAPLLDHVRERALDRTARLRLLCAIADAIQHAHQRGVIHRDLKPANVLVDATGQPKVLDFGIAAARDENASRTTQATSLSEVLGTLPYMSPERLGDAPAPIDTRTDVYSLGVLAYEVLCGRLPFALDGLSLPAAARTIAEGTPRPLGAEDPSLRFDLEIVVAKAMARDPSDRYASAGDFAHDLENILAHRPIAARPTSTVRQFRLFAKRHRTLVVGVASTLLAMVSGLVATTMALEDARDARALAETRLDQSTRSGQRAEAVRGFVLALLARLDPNQGENDPGFAQLVASATRDLATRFSDHPDLEAELRLVLGGILRLSGRFQEAMEQVELAIALRRRTPGTTATEMLDAEMELAKVHGEMGRHEEALSILERHEPEVLRAFAPLDERTLRFRQFQIHCLRLTEQHTRVLEQLPQLIEAISVSTTVPLDLQLALRLDLADTWLATGKASEARRELEHCLAVAETQLGADDPKTIKAASALGGLLLSNGDLDEAERLLRRVYEHRQQRYQALHPLLLQVVHNLGALAVARGDLEEGLRRFQESASGRAIALGARDATRIGSMLSYGNLLSRMGRPKEARPVFDEILQLLGPGIESQSWLLPHAMVCSAMNRARLGEFDAAVAEARAGVELMTEKKGEGHSRTTKVRQMLRDIEAMRDSSKNDAGK